MDISRNLRHDVTHWRVTGSDGFGGSTFATPVLLKGRWEDKVEQFRNSLNEEVVSHSIVYLLTDVETGDYLALGDHSDTTDPLILNSSGTIARTVEQQHRSTDLRNLVALRKVFL